MKNKSRLLGFTLIELLFVIAIVSVLVSLGLSMMKQRSQQAKIEKTALQMQQLMQAGMAYYVDNKCWPVEIGGVPNGCASKNPPDFGGYIPVNGTQNPWGDTYSWGSNQSKFEVRVNTPDPSGGSAPIAQRIAGMLPNANVGVGTGGGCSTSNCVFAQATIPAQAVNASAYVAAVGTVNQSATKTASFMCQSGYNPNIQVSLRDYVYKHQSEIIDSIVYTPTFPINIAFDTILSSDKTYYTVNINANAIAVHCSALAAGLFASRVIFYCDNAGGNHGIINSTDIFYRYTLNYTVYCVKS